MGDRRRVEVDFDRAGNVTQLNVVDYAAGELVALRVLPFPYDLDPFALADLFAECARHWPWPLQLRLR